MKSDPSPPTKTRDFVERLTKRAQATPDSLAYVYLTDGEDDQVSYTLGQLDLRARAIGQQLIASGMTGERALLLFPPGLDFVAALYGCFYAGVVAVPAYPPRRNRNMKRIQAIAADADARLALSVHDHVSRVERFIEDTPRLAAMEWFAADCINDALADEWKRPEIDADTLAVLQYTSGSTGEPKGVMLTHSNILHNCRLITTAFGASDNDVGMSWLPTYHDMGLVGGVLNPMFIPCPSILMSPTAFLQKPVRWLKAITKFGVTISGGPNFAYDVCTKKVTREEMEELDLSSWTLAFNGAEPVRSQTLQDFSRKFASCGFKPEAFYPCYGMAESTLMITGGTRDVRCTTRPFHASLLDAGQVYAVESVDPNARQLVGCGKLPVEGHVRIVDPETCEALPENVTGEIWVATKSVGQGYLNKTEETKATFKARLNEDDGHEYLRTGDLGFFHEDELFVTGRIKDLIIVRGVNRYPQDIEQTVVHSDPRLRTGAAAAFAVDMHDRDQLIVVCEVERIAENNWDEVIGAIRRSVTVTHELPPDGIILIRAGSIPKTSSGKIQRHACRAGFLDDSLMVVADWFAWNSPTESRASNGHPANGDTNHRNGHGTDLATNGHSRNGATNGQSPDMLRHVYDAVKQVANGRAGDLTPDTNIVELGLDSLERLEIASRLEDQFGRTFPEEVLSEIETCQQVADAAAAYLTDPARGNGHHGNGHPTNGNDNGHRVVPAQSTVAEFPEYQRLKQVRNALDEAGIPNPYFDVHEGVTRDTTVINGKTLINFSSYNYIGMSGEPRVSEAAAEAARNYGTSCSASRLVSGEKPIHGELESAIADFIGVEDSIVFVGGHATNETTIGHLCGAGDLILHDSLSHNSIVQGATLSGARKRQFAHNDWQALDDLLTSLRDGYRRALVVIEGVYSMDGDFPDLPKFIEVKKRHKAMLMVDEAHSIGTMGPTGRGIGEHFAINPNDVDVWMGTLSKSFGSCGGYIAGSKELVELLKYTAPGFVYSVGLSPTNAAAALASLQILMEQPERAVRCRARAELFIKLASEAGLNTGTSHGTPVIPVILGDSRKALMLSRQLLHHGINVQPIMSPAVEESAARLRFFISSEHTEQQIHDTVSEVSRQLRLIEQTASESPTRRIDVRSEMAPKNGRNRQRSRRRQSSN